MFSKDARWDRHTPEQSRNEDVIDVGVIFSKGKIVPKTFVWKARKYYIEKMTYQWEEKRGGQTLQYFAVTDQTNVYYIYFNSRRMFWRLDRVCPIA